MPPHPYEHVANVIRGRIQDGTYPAGSRLPTRAELRAEFSVSEITINGAMRVLRAEGLVVTRVGVAACVADQLPDTR